MRTTLTTKAKKISLSVLFIISIMPLAKAQWQGGTDIYNTNTGNIGIGTTNPKAKAEIKYTDPTIYGLLVNRYSETSGGGGGLDWTATIKEYNSTGSQMLGMSKTLSASTGRSFVVSTTNNEIRTLCNNISSLGTELTKITLKNWDSRLSDEYLVKVYLTSVDMNETSLRLMLLNSKDYATLSKQLADYSSQLKKRADVIAGLTAQQGTQTSSSDKPLFEVRTETLYTSGAIPAGTPNPEIKSKLTLTSLGYLGINNNNPQAPIDVQRTSGAVNNPIAILGPDTRGMQFVNILTLNSYNKIVAAGDQGIFWTGSYGLVIAPKNTTATSGIRIANNGNVGIGISNPLAKLHVAQSSSTAYAACIENNAGSGAGLWIKAGAGSSSSGEYNLLKVSRYSTADGITDLLRVDGKTGITYVREIKVNLNAWPDYVFEKDYNIMSLEKLESYIKEHKHLPDVPSEKEVLKDGANLGEMNALLLKKMEEITLYMIDLKKENESLKKAVEELKNK